MKFIEHSIRPNMCLPFLHKSLPCNLRRLQPALSDVTARSLVAWLLEVQHEPGGFRARATRQELSVLALFLEWQTYGAHTAEASDLIDLLDFAEQFDVASSTALDGLIKLVASTVANAETSQLKARLQILKAGRALKLANAVEELALLFDAAPTPQHAATLLERIAKQPKARVFRREIFYGVVAAFRRCAERKCSLVEAMQQVRDGYRHAGRKVAGRVVGSTLLLKGLEADAAVVLYPEEMDAKNLYVAMTRGARKLVICSAAGILVPQPDRRRAA